MRPFAWSWSRLKNWRACPKRHWHVDIVKDYREIESTALLAGNEFHKQIAGFIEHGIELPVGMKAHDKWPIKLRQLKEGGVEVRTELKLAMSKDFTPTLWMQDETWCRVVVDVLALDPDMAVAVDWKTGGKMRPEFEQLGITAQLLFAHYPTLKEVHTAYYWSQWQTEDREPKAYKREEMLPFWNRLLPEIKQMEEAHRTTTYPPKPGGLCIDWCPVKSCKFHGVGNRR